jgi:hypothetical protein
MKKQLKFAFLTTSILILSSCVNLKTLHSYSEASQEALKKYDEIGFSFKKVCEKNCEFEINSDEEAIATRLSDNYKPIKKESECKCDNYLKADTAFNKMYFAILQYLEGLNKLSNDDVLSFKYDTLANALKETEILDVKEEEIDAFNKIVATTTKFIVDVKRRKDLQEIIEFANPSFQVLVGKLQFAVEGPLKLALETEIDLEYNYYKAIIINQKELSLKDKLELENEFIEKRDAILEKINLLTEYSKALEEIKKGHQSIYDNRDKIHKKEITGLIAGYITEIKEIKTTFDNIKTEE